MKLLVASVLFALVATALCMGGGGPFKILDMVMGPPATIGECMDRMKMKMDLKITMMEEMFEAKWGCKEKCLDAKTMACMPGEDFRNKLKEKHESLKKEFLAVKEKARKCIEGKVGKGCSETPIRWGLCGLGIAKRMLGKENKMCIGECMMDKVEAKVMEFVKANAKDIPVAALAKLKAKMARKFKGKEGKEKKMMMMKGMMMKKMKGMCIMQFCEVDALMDCAKSSGLEEMYKKKKAIKSEFMKTMEAEMFPKVCTCLKKTATNLPEYLKGFNCENKYNKDVCGKLHVDYLEHLSQKFEAEKAARKKREVEHIFNLDEFEDAEHLDAFDLE